MSFNGTFVVSDAGIDYCLLYAADWTVHGFDVDQYIPMRPHRSSVDLFISNLTLRSSGEMAFRTLTGNNIINLSVAKLSGSGSLRFGTTSHANDTNGVWSLSVTDAASNFAGTVALTRGELSFGNGFALDDAAFTIDSSEDNRVVLAANVTFGTVSYGESNLVAGTYSARDFNVSLNTSRFSGAETLTILQ